MCWCKDTREFIMLNAVMGYSKKRDSDEKKMVL
jgi:hypothetical protein